MLIALAVCAGCGSGGSSKKTSSTSDSKVSAGTYVGAVCSAIAPLEKDVVSRSAALKKTTDRPVLLLVSRKGSSLFVTVPQANG